MGNNLFYPAHREKVITVSSVFGRGTAYLFKKLLAYGITACFSKIIRIAVDWSLMCFSRWNYTINFLYGLTENRLLMWIIITYVTLGYNKNLTPGTQGGRNA